MASLYRACVSTSQYTIAMFNQYTGCMFNTGRGLDRKLSAVYEKSMSETCVETGKTLIKVRSVAASSNDNEMSDVTFLDDSQPSVTSTPVSKPSKRAPSEGWREYLNHDLTEFGITLTSEDFNFKHKFFRTDLQKLRRAIILKHMEKVEVLEMGFIGSVVANVEERIGLQNPTWDRKSKKRFMDILSSEKLISQMGVKYDRAGVEKEVHLVVLPHIDENHQLVHKVVSDKATVRYMERDQIYPKEDESAFADAEQTTYAMMSETPRVSMLNGDVLSNSATAFDSEAASAHLSSVFLDNSLGEAELVQVSVEQAMDTMLPMELDETPLIPPPPKVTFHRLLLEPRLCVMRFDQLV